MLVNFTLRPLPPFAEARAQNAKLFQRSMELLLNLTWIALGAAAFLVFLRRRPGSGQQPLPFRRALLALACAFLLLFPIVSASDDLHPTQAVLEDATRRVQQLAVPLHIAHGGMAPMLPLLLLCCLYFALALPFPWGLLEFRATALRGYRSLAPGRSPPLRCNSLA